MKRDLFHPGVLLALLKRSAGDWKADNAMSMGAALAFYSILSLAPLLVLVIMITGMVIGRDQAQELLMTQLSGLLGETGAQGVQVMLDNADTGREGLVGTAVSAFLLLLGATTVFGELQDDMNRIWKCEAPKRSGLWGQLRKRFVSFGLIVVIGFLLLVSLAVSAVVSYLGTAWLSGAGEALARGLELAASIGVTTLLFALMFKILPSRRIPWGDVLLGALITAVLFAIGKYLIGLYIGKSAVASKFGAAGTLVVVILWVYYSAQIFFFGAEFTKGYAMQHGSKSPAAANMEFGSNEAAMVARAERIVRGQDPVLTQRNRS